MTHIRIITLFCLMLAWVSCSDFDDLNENPNEPTDVSSDVLLTNAIRNSVNTSVDASYLVGNNAAQLTAKTLRVEVDAYNWNAFPTYWQGWYGSLTDIKNLEEIAITENNEVMEGVAIVLRSWVFQNLTDCYGNVPYSEATSGSNQNFTPAYDNQQAIYEDLLSELTRANGLLAGEGNITGDILLGNDALKWRKFCNALRLRLLMHASNQMDVAGQFSSIVDASILPASNADNITLTYTSGFPNQFPLIPLKEGDFDAVAIAAASANVMEANHDPRLMRYARPNNDSYEAVVDPAFVDAAFIGAVNGQGDNCPKDGASRLGIQYYNYPGLAQASSLGLPMAEGIVLTYSEVEFLIAEAAAKGWISADVETHYRNGIEASLIYHQAAPSSFGWEDFEDFYNNSGIAYGEATDIWEQKWLALFFHGMEPYFELRRWYNESGNSFDGIPFVEASCGNMNNGQLPFRFLYPGEEQSLNASSYQAALNEMGGMDDQNFPIWVVQ